MNTLTQVKGQKKAHYPERRWWKSRVACAGPRVAVGYGP